MAKYDAKEVTKQTNKIKLAWHGAPTLVKLEHDGSAKVEVETGGVIEVSGKRAEELLHYSPLWTLEGDKPLEQSKAKAAPKAAAAASGDAGAEKPVSKMNRAELVEAAKARGIEVAEADKVADIRAKIAEADAAKNEGTQDDGEGDEENDEE